MQTIAKKVVQNWAAKGYISDDEVEMCLYNLIRHTFTVAVLCVLTVVGALLGEWSNTIVFCFSVHTQMAIIVKAALPAFSLVWQ